MCNQTERKNVVNYNNTVYVSNGLFLGGNHDICIAALSTSLNVIFASSNYD